MCNYVQFNSNLSYVKTLLIMRKMTGCQATLIQKISNSKEGTRLKKDLGLTKKQINEILDELEEVFKVSISGTDREEIVTREDLITAVILQLTKNLTP